MMINTLSIFSDIFGHPILNIFMLIDSVIYGFINKIYQVFITIASAQIFSMDNFRGIADRMYTIVGVVMLFVVAYSILKAIINPDDAFKGELSIPKVIQNVIISIVLIAVVPTIFNLLYQAQGLILRQNIVGKIILGGTNNEGLDVGDKITLLVNGKNVTIDVKEDANMNMIKSAGADMSATIFRAFFVPTESESDGTDPSNKIEASVDGYFSEIKGPIQTVTACLSGNDSGVVETDLEILNCALNLPLSLLNTVAEIGKDLLSFVGIDTGEKWTLAEADEYAKATGDIGIYTAFFDKVSDKEIDYSFFLASAAGIFVCWTLVAYCIDLGVRAVKLGFYQIIAPIPIMTRAIPKQKKIFNNWVKIVLTTFAEVFVRVAVIFFVIFLIQAIPNIFENFWTNSILGTPSWGVRGLARVFIILGLLAFAKQAPKLISDIVGIDSKNMSLGINIGKKLGENGALAIPTAVGGFVTGGVRRFMNPSEGRTKRQRVTDAFSSAAKGGYKGAKTGWTAKGFGDVKKGATTAAYEAQEEQAKKVAEKTKKTREKEAYKASQEYADGVPYWEHQLKDWATKGGKDYQEKALSQMLESLKALEEIFKNPKESSKERIKSITEDLAKGGHYVDPEGFMKVMEKYNTTSAAQEAIRDGSIRGAIAEQAQRYIDDGTYEAEWALQKKKNDEIKGIKAVESDAAIRELGKHMERVAAVVENISSDLSTSGAIGQKTVDMLKEVFAKDDKKDIFDMTNISTVPELTAALKKLVATANEVGPTSAQGQAALKAVKTVVEEAKKVNTDSLANLKDELSRKKREEKK